MGHEIIERNTNEAHSPQTEAKVSFSSLVIPADLQSVYTKDMAISVTASAKHDAKIRQRQPDDSLRAF